MFSLLLSTWNDLGHLPDTQGYQTIYLDHVCTLRPFKSYGRGGGGGGGVVAHKILVTSPEAKFLFPFLGLFGALGFEMGLGLGLVNILPFYQKRLYHVHEAKYP